jgi:transcriptional regulator with XRE-family HTH domain
VTHLKFERMNRGLRQRDLARKSGVSRHNLSQMENGRLVPTADELARLSSVLGIPADVLMTPVVALRIAAEPTEAVGAL